MPLSQRECGVPFLMTYKRAQDEFDMADACPANQEEARRFSDSGPAQIFKYDDNPIFPPDAFLRLPDQIFCNILRNLV